LYYPDRQEFHRRAEQGDLIPVYREILADMETPVSAFAKLQRQGDPYCFLLESVEGGERIARYSFLGTAPSRVLRAKGRHVELRDNGTVQQRELVEGEDALHVLKELMGARRYVPIEGWERFCGGAVGYIAYDMVRFFEELPDQTEDDLDLPDCLFMLTDSILIFDHVRHRIRVLTNAHVRGDPDAAYDEALFKIKSLIALLREPAPPSIVSPDFDAAEELPFRSNVTREQFEDAVRAAKEYIAAGDIIQVVLSQRLETKVSAAPFDVYRALRSINPSPYMYYLSLGDLKIIGSSPEILVTEDRGTVVTRPLAGTRRRGTTDEADAALEAELRADEKERAEHVMLVDLGRNDIGRVCEYGSVEVTELMGIERYSHVMHIVSNVRGRLSPGKDQFDVLRACFPAGTVSGAPKIRAMEIIEELEPTKRGPYAGAIGYFSFSGSMDTAITIRTIVMKGSTAYVQAGAGIVADSVPEREYEETMNKAMALLGAIRAAEAGLR
jgi:anthranilate synthase component 1